MAFPVITSIGQTGFQWYVLGLDNTWDDTNYYAAYCEIQYYNPSSSSWVRLSDSYVYPLSTGIGNYTPYTTVSYIPSGGYYFYTAVYVYSYSVYNPTTGTYGDWVFVSEQYNFTRPSNFSWSSTVASNNTIAITATEWNHLTDTVIKMYHYHVQSDTTFPDVYYVSSGSPITAYTFNVLRSYIAACSPSTSAPSSVTQDVTTLSASMFTTLQNSLNSIS